MRYYIDLDDFAEENTDWDLILRLKKAVPNLKLNLFTIPGMCRNSFLAEMREVKWIQTIPHGYVHRTSRECEQWPYDVANNYLAQLEREGWVKGFKAPGWQYSQELLQCLADRDWWAAIQDYDQDRCPAGLRIYLLDSPYKFHGHIGHWGAHNTNSLEYLFDSIAALKGEFGFIDEIWDGI